MFCSKGGFRSVVHARRYFGTTPTTPRMRPCAYFQFSSILHAPIFPSSRLIKLQAEKYYKIRQSRKYNLKGIRSCGRLRKARFFVVWVCLVVGFPIPYGFQCVMQFQQAVKGSANTQRSKQQVFLKHYWHKAQKHSPPCQV